MKHTATRTLHLPWARLYSTWSICPWHWSIVTSNNFAALHCWSSCAEESVIILEWNITNQKSHLLHCDKNFNQEATKVQNTWRSLTANHSIFSTQPGPLKQFILYYSLFTFLEDTKLWLDWIQDISNSKDNKHVHFLDV